MIIEIIRYILRELNIFAILLAIRIYNVFKESYNFLILTLVIKNHFEKL